LSSSKKAFIGSKILFFFFGIPMLIWGFLIIYYKYARGIDLTATIGVGIVGFLMVVSGITSVHIFRHNRVKVLGALQSYERISLAQLSSELKLSEKKTKAAIVDLRTEGKLKASFEPDTGDVLVFEVNGEPVMAVVPVSSSGLPEHEEKYKHKHIPKEHDYCQYCGSIVKPDSQFCNNCGSFLS